MGTRAIVVSIALLLIIAGSAFAQMGFGTPGSAAHISRLSGLTVHMKLDEGSGLRHDSGPRDNYFIPTGVVHNVEGKVDKAAAFIADGNTNFLFSPKSTWVHRPYLVNSSPHQQRSYTILAWIYPSTNVIGRLWGSDQTGVPSAFQDSLSNSVPILEHRVTASFAQIANIGLVVSNWNLVALGVDALRTNRFISINGSNKISEATGPADQDVQSGESFTLGLVSGILGKFPKSGTYFIDDFHFWNKPLSTEEIRWFWNNSHGNSFGDSVSDDLVPASMPPPAGNTNEWYVATNGLVGNTGRTIGSPKPIDWIWNNTHPAAPTGVGLGHTVWFLPGWYEGGTGPTPEASGGNNRWTNIIKGTASQPVTFRNWQNGRVTLHNYTNQGTIMNHGAWTRIIGFEFTCTSPVGHNPQGDQNLSIRPTGYNSRGFSNAVINCVFTRMGNAIGQNSTVSGTNELYYGNVFFYNGWQYNNDGGSGTGYPMYVRNDWYFKGPTIIKHNLFAPNFDFAMHCYGTGSTNSDIHALENAYWLAGNVSSNARTRGIWVTQVGGKITNHVFGGNAFYSEFTNNAGATMIQHGSVDLAHGPNVSVVFTNNWLHSGYGMMNTWRSETNHFFSNNTMIARGAGFALVGGHGGVAPGTRQNVVRNWNTYYSVHAASIPKFTYRKNASSAVGEETIYNLGDWQSVFGYDLNSTFNPTPARVTNYWVWKNEYEANRAHVFIVNANTNGTPHVNNFEIDVSSVFANGTVVNVRNTTHFYQKEDNGAAHAVRTVTAGKITIPMTNMLMQPATVLSQTSGNFPFRVTGAGTNGSVAGFVLTTW